MFTKWFKVLNPKGKEISVQGNGEKLFAEYLAKHKCNFERGRQIKTPFGNYTPDFDLGYFYVEVKGTRSLLAAMGILPLLENGRKDCFTRISDNSLKKMEWVNLNSKPIVIFLNENTNDSSYMESDDWDKIVSNIPIIYQIDNFIEFLLLNTEDEYSNKIGSQNFINNLLLDKKYNLRLKNV